MITQYSYGLEPKDSMSANVKEIYKTQLPKEIRADLETKRNGMVNICMNLRSDANIANVIRTNNAFCGKCVYIVGRRRYNKVPATGMHHYENVYHADTLQEVVDLLHDDNYMVYAVENCKEYNPTNLYDVSLPEKVAFLYGNEGAGLSEEQVALCDGVIEIKQYGAVRSLNVATAAAILNFEYCRQLN